MDKTMILTGWNELESKNKSAIPGGAEVIGTGVFSSLGEASLTYENGIYCGIRLPVPPGWKPPKVELSASLAVKKLPRPLQGGAVENNLLIECISDDLRDVFAQFAERLLERIGKGEIVSKAFGGTVTEFRRLLGGSTQGKVTKAQMMGLIGELAMLELLQARIPDAIEGWFGPEDNNSHNDFRYGAKSLEMKTTGRAAELKVSISSVDQLYCSPNGSLHLAILHLEESGSGSVSVKTAAERCVQVGVPVDQLASKLKKLECDYPVPDTWCAKTFEFGRWWLFEVDDAFPKIVPGSFKSDALPEGVGDFGYTISLGHIVNRSIADNAGDVVEKYIVNA